MVICGVYKYENKSTVVYYDPNRREILYGEYDCTYRKLDGHEIENISIPDYENFD